MKQCLASCNRCQSLPAAILTLVVDGGIRQPQVYNYTGEMGTYRYMAPEVYRHEPYNGKADVYRCASWLASALWILLREQLAARM